MDTRIWDMNITDMIMDNIYEPIRAPEISWIWIRIHPQYLWLFMDIACYETGKWQRRLAWGNFITCNIQHTQFVKHSLFSDLVLIDIVIELSQSSIKSYASARPLQPPQELLDRNPFNWAIETMQPLHYLIILFFGRSGMIFLAFLQVWILCSFSRRVDEEFVKARTRLKKGPGEIGNCGTISLSLDGWKSHNGYKICWFWYSHQETPSLL
jgi:hypothetical protein